MRNFLGLLLLLCSCLFIGCKDDMAGAGSAVLPDDDQIVVNVDTFSITSGIRSADVIYEKPDSFLLGECDNQYGTIHADVLSQFACPVGFRFPENAEVDSVCLVLYYNSWFGDGSTPLQLQVYEMDLNTFEYERPYSNAVQLEYFCSLSDESKLLEHEKIIVANNPEDSLVISSTKKPISVIRLKTTKAFADRLFSQADFTSQDAFNEKFKGLYLTSTFGSATVLHVIDMTMYMYYHFTYDKMGKDTTVNDVKAFYANSEVRQVNRIDYVHSVFDEMGKELFDSLNYIISPRQVYTHISLPVQEMAEHIYQEVGSRRPYVNQAKLSVEVLNYYTGTSSGITVDEWAQPAPNMMLIKEDAIRRFFDKHELPSDSCAIVSSLMSEFDKEGNNKHFKYEYDLSTLLTAQLRDEMNPDTLQMVLLPVEVEQGSSSSSSSVSAVRPLQTISATVIRSAQSKEKPLRLDVIYCGF